MNRAYAYPRGVLFGVERFCRQRPDWVVHVESSEDWDAIAPWRPDGAIVQVRESDTALRIGKVCPAVNVSSSAPSSPLPRVAADNKAIGRLAARHLLDNRFSRFGFVGESGVAYAEERLAGFRAELGEEGLECTTLLLSAWGHLGDSAEGLSEWLLAQSRPLAIMAASDDFGQAVTRACARLDLGVPNDVAVVGVDNCPLFCRWSRPELTSVDPNPQAIGYQAAESLAVLLQGDNVPDQTLLPPLELVCRQSSDVLAVEDDIVRRAVAYMRINCRESIGVDQVAAELGTTRRTLERRFRRALDMSPVQELHEARLRLARRTLEKTDQPISQVAAEMGFGTPQHFTAFFRQRAGCTPSAYRERHQTRPGSQPVAGLS